MQEQVIKLKLVSQNIAINIESLKKSLALHNRKWNKGILVVGCFEMGLRKWTGLVKVYNYSGTGQTNIEHAGEAVFHA